jgi:hypothetical protein
MPISQKKLDANRRNARKSTGPRTPQGKARSARNATSHGLFCKDLVLPDEPQRVFHAMRNLFISSLNPQDITELMLVDRIVAANWKLRRLQEAERLFYWDEENELLKIDALQGHLDRRYADDPHEDQPRKPEDLRPIPAAVLLCTQLNSEEDKGRFERMSRYEQRLEMSIHRAMRQLRQLRKDRMKAPELPESPYLDEELPEEDEPQVKGPSGSSKPSGTVQRAVAPKTSNVENEATARSETASLERRATSVAAEGNARPAPRAGTNLSSRERQGEAPSSGRALDPRERNGGVLRFEP